MRKLVRLTKKTDMNTRDSIIIRTVAIFLAMLTSTLIIRLLGHNPVQVYLAMIDGCFGSAYRFKETITYAIPLAITALGILVAFKMKFWNIGGEGQICMGAVFATYVALNYSSMPKILLLPLMIIASLIGGGLWAMIPAYFKSKYNTNETLFTLMMNYIAIKIVTYLQYGPWKDPNAFGFPKIPTFTDNAILPKVLGINIGWIITIVLIGLIYLLMHHTKLGYEISVIGESENTGRYAGMKINKVILLSIMISGALCGLTGMIQASAVNNTLSVGVSGGIGYTGIIIAWLSGLKAPVVAVTAILFSVLEQGGSYIQTAFQIPQSAADIFQGIILMFVLGSEFFIQYKININRSKEKGGNV